MREILRSAIRGFCDGSVSMFDLPIFVSNSTYDTNYDQALRDIRRQIKIMNRETIAARDSIIQEINS